MLSKEEGGLSFRDLAMLEKQGLWLWKNPDSLCAYVLKAKYFANSLFLEAKTKAGVSYSWQSIL
jgi:hypothetical protein